MDTKSTQFGDFESQYYDPDTAEIVLLPVAYDGTSTWVKGADAGPEAILKASYNLEFYDIDTDSQVYQRGIYTEPAISDVQTPDEMVRMVRRRTEMLLDGGKFPVVLGGEHSVSIGAIEAVAGRFENLTVLQLDAHADLRDEYEGSKYNHACVMARAAKLSPIVQVGIRSMDASEKEAMEAGRVFFAHELCGRHRKRWIEEVVSQLTENVYLTIDLDVFDPAVLPATGTPEPGGLGWYDVCGLVKAVCAAKNLVGFDVVELCPRDEHWGSDFLAAKLVYKTLSYRFQA
ncbi:MAG: agmatinase [Planctomycetota bacterium]|jgi:agmatinase